MMSTTREARAGLVSSSTQFLSLALPVIMGLLMTDPAAAQASRAGTGEVIAIRELELKPGVDSAEFERFVTEEYNPAMEGGMPGVKMYIAKADRGQNPDSYAHFIVFDSQKTRDAIAPRPDEGPAEWAAPMWEELQPLQQELGEYVEEGWFDTYTDYVVLR